MDKRFSKYSESNKKNKLTIGIMGTSQYKHLVPVFEEYEYQVVDLQEIFDSNMDKLMKEKVFRDKLQYCDLLYNLFSGNHFWAKASYAKSVGKKVFTHWIGTDALDAIEGRLGYLGAHFIDHNFSCYEGITQELLQVGINTTVLPIIPFDMELALTTMPTKHAVMIYIPENRLDHYGYSESCVLFERFPNVEFHIVANSNTDLFKKFKNVIVHGRLSHSEMDTLYKSISILVRWIKHDGLSMSVIEALAKGKEVIWNFPYRGVNYVKSVEEMCAALGQIVSRPPVINIEASKYVCEKLTKENFIDEFERVLFEKTK